MACSYTVGKARMDFECSTETICGLQSLKHLSFDAIKKKFGARKIAQWYKRTCLAGTRSWVRFPISKKKKKKSVSLYLERCFQTMMKMNWMVQIWRQRLEELEGQNHGSNVGNRFKDAKKSGRWHISIIPGLRRLRQRVSTSSRPTWTLKSK